MESYCRQAKPTNARSRGPPKIGCVGPAFTQAPPLLVPASAHRWPSVHPALCRCFSAGASSAIDDPKLNVFPKDGAT